MLKFQDNNTTSIATFEDFILTVYVMIDDLYRQFAPSDVTNRRHVWDAKLSDSEIITISICGELAGIDSERAWFSFVKRNYRHLFPRLCSRSRFNRTRRALLQTTEWLRQKMEEKGICLMALKRSNSKTNFPKPVLQLIFKLQRRVETVFSQLNGQLNAERILAKSFQGLCHQDGQ